EGQWDAEVDFLARGAGYRTVLGAEGPMFVLEPGEHSPGAALRMTLAGAGRLPPAQGVDPLPGSTSYFLGPDPAGWHTRIPTYAATRYVDVYPGTDLVFRGVPGGGVEYDFVLEPGADPGQIGMRFAGVRGIRIDDQGALILPTVAGDLVHREPTVYQVVGGERVEVEGAYVLDGRRVGFDLGAYDPSLLLVIDPVVMVYSTVLGGEDTDNPFNIAVDGGGAAYIAGYTFDATIDYPTTPGAFDTTPNGDDDVFVTKLAPDGGSLLYSTFLGGGSGDFGFDIAVDGSGAAYVVGSTMDAVADFPTTAGAFDQTHNGDRDAFVTKLLPSGAGLAYSTFLGSGDFDIGFGVDVDGAGSAYVTGEAADDVTEFPTTPGAYDETYNGGARDVFVTKVAPSGSALAFSTFLGGDGSDKGIGIAVDDTGAASATGETSDSATDFPTTAGAYDETHNGSQDTFLARLTPSGSALQFSTFLGGAGFDTGFRVAVDGGGAAFVTGGTSDSVTDYPTTAGAFDTTHNGGLDAFLTKVHPAGSSLVYSTFLGGTGSDEGRGIALDPAGTAFITGNSTDAATDYPTTSGAFDTTHNGSGDAVVTRVSADGSALLYSSFLGGSMNDVGWGVAVDAAGAFYVAGETFDGDPDYPTTPGAFDRTHNGSYDGFVTKLADPGICKGKPVTILGTLSGDSLTGTAGADVFSALAGNDQIVGLGAGDTACAGDGKDLFNGGPGKDVGVGGIGNDTLKGGPKSDRLFGEKGKDRLKGAAGNDRMNGGPGKDTCAGGGGRDKAPKCEKERSVP
ncbi:MAG: hypothetical protein ACRDHB_05850, partial [Actinomycetota bacterium]